jgi:CDP-glucose 4,6-dehydratase
MAAFSDAYRGRRVLVTGHTGFKGSWLSVWLRELGAEVCGYSNGVPTQPSLFEAAGLAQDMRNEQGDIRDLARLSSVLEDFRPDFVFHLAAQAIVSASYVDPVETVSSNVLGTATVLQALRSVDQPCAAVLVASDKCYENREWPWGYRENDRLGGRDVYSASKGAGEIIVRSFYRSFFEGQADRVRIGTVRAGNVLGGGDWAADRIVADCVRAWSAGERVPIRRPYSTRPWQHVLEPLSGYLALGARLMADEALNGESFNFGPPADQDRTVLALIADLARSWGFDDPAESYRVTDTTPFHEAGLLKLSCDKALALLQWAPSLSYGECVGLTGDWYRSVLKDRAGALEVTLEQIAAYGSTARARGRAWAV